MHWLLYAIGVISFLAGGVIISDSWHIDRTLSEFLGMGIAAASFFAGHCLKSAAEDFSAEERRALDDHE